jgi:hypothetical protein
VDSGGVLSAKKPPDIAVVPTLRAGASGVDDGCRKAKAAEVCANASAPLAKKPPDIWQQKPIGRPLKLITDMSRAEKAELVRNNPGMARVLFDRDHSYLIQTKPGVMKVSVGGTTVADTAFVDSGSTVQGVSTANMAMPLRSTVRSPSLQAAVRCR